ncbi:MAG TPA: penicillin acylase family protein [Chryseolinea sp.]|nr:penicillin acylase family protein [Chryseolinea sp.]HPM31994.1 penicillin acylase family protein [Chryseolinea sp.]
MKVFKFTISLIITLGLIILLNNSWIVSGNRIPPLGKFLDPFHGFWQNIEPGNYTGEEELEIPGLRDQVTIVFDSLLIPHIFAHNDEDLYLAQGYVTAMHRLFQMEIQTHDAAGRISEIVGDRALDHDRSQRRLGMVSAAEKSLKAMMENTTSRTMVEKYSEGINLYISSLSYNDLPLEYKLLDYEPEPWTPLKCALLLKNMAKTLNMGDKDMQMTNALNLFGPEMIDVLYPDFEGVSDPIVDRTNQWKFNAIILDTVPMAVPDELINVKKLPPSDPTTGSNNWAVSGSKTATGSPLLSGDPHLNLTLPSIWYAIQLHAPGVNTMGASLPGSPGVIIGFNDSVAWSVTNAQRDLVDWFKISFENDTKEKYKLDGDWVNTNKVIEAIHVRDKEIFYDTVVHTHWGPITYDESFHAENQLSQFAFRWMSHDASNEVLTFYKLNRAKNHDDYTEALNQYGTPAQNFVFAAVNGDIAMRIQGKYPVRRKNEGRFVLDGSKSSNGWQAFIPNDQNVMDKNPERGFVSSANQYPVDITYPYYVTGRSFEAYRNRRINTVLSALSSAQPSDMMKLQNDNYNLKAEESLPTFLSYLDSTKFSKQESDAYVILKSWDYFNNKDSEGASYYEAWWDNLLPLIWDEMNTEGKVMTLPSTYNTISLIKQKPDLTFFDIQSTSEKETAKEVVRKAFLLGVEDILRWKSGRMNSFPGADLIDYPKVEWADYKDSYIGHLLRLEPLSIHVKAGGNHDIVNAHSKTHGPSWRMVVSLEKSGVKTWAVYPGGQSGNPGSEHYNDQLNRWVEGKYFSLLFLQKPEDAGNKLFYSTHLNPEPK